MKMQTSVREVEYILLLDLNVTCNQNWKERPILGSPGAIWNLPNYLFGKPYILETSYSVNSNNSKSSENGYYEFTIIPLICWLRSSIYDIKLSKKKKLVFLLFLAVAVDGRWSCWSEWSSCDASFKRRRTRECNNPSPINGGKPCKGEREEEEDCYVSVFMDK